MAEQTEWKQVRYGKIVESKGGPILNGEEHRITSMSPDIGNVVSYCYPKRVGMGAGDLTDWGRYPWPLDGKSGGLTVQPVCSKGEWHVIAARVSMRPERPQWKHSRLYTEVHYLIHGNEGLEQLPLYDFGAHLRADPLIKNANPELPLVSIEPDKSETLPKGWFQEVKPMLKNILIGQGHRETDPNRTPEEFYQLARRALACLPATLRWRIPIVAGGEKIESHIGLGHGREVSGREANIVPERVGRQAEKIIDAIEKFAADKVTLAEVCEVVDSRLRKYSNVLFRDETLPPAMGIEKMAGFWRNSVGRFRSEIFKEPWVEPPEPIKQAVTREAPSERVPERSESQNTWVWKAVGIGGALGSAVLGTALALGLRGCDNGVEKPSDDNKPKTPWIDRSSQSGPDTGPAHKSR